MLCYFSFADLNVFFRYIREMQILVLFLFSEVWYYFRQAVLLF